MILHVEAGHGESYRSAGTFDLGLMADSGEYEAAICREYATCLRVLAERRGHKTAISISGSPGARLKCVLGRNTDVLVSFHMDADMAATPGGRVVWGMAGALSIADAVGAALGFPAMYEEPARTLHYNPSIEVHLGNIVCWSDMKKLPAKEHCEQICLGILSALEPFFLPGAGPGALSAATEPVKPCDGDTSAGDSLESLQRLNGDSCNGGIVAP